MSIGYNDEERALLQQGEDTTKRAVEMYKARGRAMPLLDRMVFARTERCSCCGAGMAYDPFGEPTPPFKFVSQWTCSAVILGTATSGVHDVLSMIIYDVKGERDDQTTRPTPTKEP